MRFFLHLQKPSVTVLGRVLTAAPKHLPPRPPGLFLKTEAPSFLDQNKQVKEPHSFS